LARLTCSGCGASAPEGSNFCPDCGAAQGSLERPRTAAATEGGWVEFIDRTWDFFASTKVASTLIVLIAVASTAGTLIEQESLYQDWRPPYLYYPSRYGEFWGNLYMKLGLTHAYSSVWYATIVLMIFISLVICSLHRLIPLYKTLARPQVWKLPHFIQRQEVVHEVGGNLDEMAAKLRKKGYKVLRDRECLYGDKGQISRYGPYIIHIGLLIVCMAAFMKAIPGWEESKDVWVPDGQTVKVPDTNFAITNHKFTMELYPNGAPARFATDASIVQNGQEAVRKTIEVNHPLSFGGWDIYQASWREEPGVAHVKVLGDLPEQPLVGTVDIDLRQPEQEYKLNDRVKMVVTSYYHDFAVDHESQQPTNASFEVKNPVFMVEFFDLETSKSVGRAALAVFGNGQPVYEGPLYLALDKVDTRWFTALKLHRDLTTPYMFGGLAVVMLGMLLTFFVFHWQVWVREEQGRLLLGARSYKNKYGLKQEFKRLLGTSNGEGTVS
jgi:cytochrome c biogenesis protein